MDRLQIIQMLLKQKNLNNYLEIGVFSGHIFFRVKSNFKIAVDPDFRFSAFKKIIKTTLNPSNTSNRYFEKTSDEFFQLDAPKVFEKNKIDIALIDGMHEFNFALRDVENTLNYLDDNGVIIMHDCNPQTLEAACSFEEWKAHNYAREWNGDVWKVILYLRSHRKDIDAFVLDCDHGLGIICKRPSQKPLPYTRDEINQFTFDDLQQNRAAWLNLQPAGYVYDSLGLLK